MNVIPLFKSHYSLGRSILTLQTPDSCIEDGPNSIINLATENNMKKLFLVEDNMSSFLEAYTHCKENDLHLIYGIRMTFCPDMNEKSEDSRSKSCKYILFIKNTEGYKKLINIYSAAAKTGFYYEPRMDFKTLKENWCNDSLLLAVPFYDSFIYKNSLTCSVCIPEIDFTKPVFFTESNNLPFDDLLEEKVKKYCHKKYKIVKAKSIYYKLKDDFKSYLTFRCINNRSTLNRPQLDHMCSDEFCLESWKEQN